MDPALAMEILKAANSQVFFSFSQDNLILSEFAMTLFLLILRRVNNSSLKQMSPLTSAYIGQYHEEIAKTLFLIPRQAEYDEEAAKYFLIMEEILISLKHANYFEDSQIGTNFIEQFIQQVLSPFVKTEEGDLTLLQQPSIIQYVVGTLRLLLLLQTNRESPQTMRLVTALAQFLKQILTQFEVSMQHDEEEGEN
jgi:hypothetical protein